jgi:hypothetical protein
VAIAKALSDAKAAAAAAGRGGDRLGVFCGYYPPASDEGSQHAMRTGGREY